MNRSRHLLLLVLVLLCVDLGFNILQTCQSNRIEKLLLERPEPLESGSATMDAEGTAPDSGEACDGVNLLAPYRPPRTDGEPSSRELRLPGNAVDNLNYYLDLDLDNQAYHRLLSNPMARLDPEDSEDPATWRAQLATCITTPDDGLTYRIRFREGVQWHPPVTDGLDGTFSWLDGPHLLTADDYAFALEVIFHEDVAEGAPKVRANLTALESWEVLDDRTLEVTFSERQRQSFSALVELVPLPRWLYGRDARGAPIPNERLGKAFTHHWYNERAIGVGPYRFVRRDLDQRIVMERNPHYWGQAPAFARLVFVLSQNPRSLQRMFEQGELHLLPLESEQVRSLGFFGEEPILEDPTIHRSRYTEHGLLFVGWNLEHPALQDAEVRRALALAVDRDYLVASVFQGLGRVPSGPVPWGNHCMDPALAPLPHDPDRARDLLEARGWRDRDGDGIREHPEDPGVPLELDLLYPSRPDLDAAVTLLREDLLAVGARLRPLSSRSTNGRQRVQQGDFGGYIGYWSLGPELDLHAAFHSSQATQPDSLNHFGIRDPELDALLEAARVAFDPQDREETCHELHHTLRKLQVLLPLLQPQRAVLYRDPLAPPAWSSFPPHRRVLAWYFEPAAD